MKEFHISPQKLYFLDSGDELETGPRQSFKEIQKLQKIYFKNLIHIENVEKEHFTEYFGWLVTD